MPSRGFVKLFRKIKDSWLIQNDHDALAVFIYILSSVSHKKHKTLVDGKVVILEAGEVVGGRRKMAEATGLSEKQVRRIMDLFEETGVTAKKRANGRAKGVNIIKLVKWKTYQIDPDTEGPAERPKKGPNEGQARAKVGPLDKKGENGKKGENKSGGRFTPPTAQEVVNYGKTIQWPDIDGDAFIDYYQARGWMLTNNRKVSDWKACVRTWKTRKVERSVQSQNTGRGSNQLEEKVAL